MAFSLIKADGLNADGRARVRREAQLLAQLGAHPKIVTVFDLGNEPGGPWSEAQREQAQPLSWIGASQTLDEDMLLKQIEEPRLALQYRKPILPLRLAEAAFPEGVEYILAGWQWVEVLDLPREEWLPRVLTAIERLT